MKGNFRRSSPTCRCLLVVRSGGAVLQPFVLLLEKKGEARGGILSVRAPAWTREAKELPAHGPGECVLLELCLDKQASVLVRSVHKHIWHELARGFVAHVRFGSVRQNVA